jgi:hypothetical protein
MRHLIAFLMCAAFIGLSVWVVASSESFSDCVEANKDQPSHHHAIEGIPQPRPASDLNKFCAGEFIHENGEAVTAFFTIVLAISTILLWFATQEGAAVARAALVEIERAFVYQTITTHIQFDQTLDRNVRYEIVPT